MILLTKILFWYFVANSTCILFSDKEKGYKKSIEKTFNKWLSDQIVGVVVCVGLTLVLYHFAWGGI